MKKYFSLIFAVFAFICSFLVFWYFVDIFERYFVLVFIPLGFAMLIWALGVIINIVCLYSSVKMRDKNTINYISLVISVVTVVFVLAFPFQEAKFKLEFKLYADEREQVVDMVANGTIVPDELGNAELPDDLDHITSDGNILIYQNDEEQVICFWIVRGMMSPSKMLIYSSQGEELIFENIGENWIANIERLKDSWYLVQTDY